MNMPAAAAKKAPPPSRPRPCPATVLKCGPDGTLCIRDGTGWKAVNLQQPRHRFRA